MSKSVLMSIRPEWCKLIVDGKKTVEVRKTRPKLETPFKVYIYCTLSGFKEFFRETLKGEIAEWNRGGWGNKIERVLGEFVCDRIFDISITDEGYDFDVPKMTGLKYEEMEAYLDHKEGYGWHISNLLIYEKPKELREFTKLRNTKFGLEPVSLVRPPQSWCYVEELEGE